VKFRRGFAGVRPGRVGSDLGLLGFNLRARSGRVAAGGRAHRRPVVLATAAASPGEGRLHGGSGYVGELEHSG
jgi:hypothetical protein